jgi:hypothetical protein
MGVHYGVTRRQVLGMVMATGGLAMSGAVSSVFAQALKRTPRAKSWGRSIPSSDR